ncbi:AraC family transcriptional regulator [Siculibacillus lacustris]|uniref:AraC family transcriptional regulator n=1 Tax=Siculibacillus lacustris TaxID=1549641 RepID=A0A4Q9VZP2_9HYPH|nr:AraC family transcriptional regulator [Siculibacillus lacustris]TBW41328.1 AraC family transcriptional regulator [Siculibacillus lacustris]
MNSTLDELRRLASGARNRRTETGIPRVAMVQGKVPEHELSAVYEPMINLILRGSKTMTVGDRVLHYDAATYFVMSVGLPAVGQVRPSATGEPYLAVGLTLEPRIIADLLSDLPVPAGARLPERGFSVAPVTADLLDAWRRMLRLMEHPDEIPALALVYEREILFRVLQGPQGAMLRAIGLPDSASARIDGAIHWIRQNVTAPLRIETLAERVAMSPSAFHRHFKAVTALSPLQYQKRVRLLAARARLIAGEGGVTAIAHDVGYESPTQFSREYARAFGKPPSKDVAAIVAGFDAAA